MKELKPGDLITNEFLRSMGACPYQRAKFRKEWPNGMPLRRKNLLRAAEMLLDIFWFAIHVLTSHEHETFDTLRGLFRNNLRSQMGWHEYHNLKHWDYKRYTNKATALAFWKAIRERTPL